MMTNDEVTAENAVKKVWAEIFRRDDIGSDENFFDLGGSSLTLMRVQVRLGEIFEKEISLVDLYGTPTIASTADLLTKLVCDDPDEPRLGRCMRDVSFLIAIPRPVNIGNYSGEIKDVLRWSDEAHLDGALIFNGAGAHIDPWVVATAAAVNTARICPLVAVNPIYQHPYTAARIIASIGNLYGRRVDLNLITGAATGDLAALGDTLDHDLRYERLAEFTEIVVGLLSSPRPYSFDGRFYRVSRLQITGGLPPGLLPHLYVAGRSSASLGIIKQFGAISLQMLPHPGAEPSVINAGAINLGVIARSRKHEAIAAAQAYFPVDTVGEKIVAATMKDTDSAWKQELYSAALEGAPADSMYWTSPVKSGQADCLYLVGDYNSLANKLADFARRGVRSFIIDTPTGKGEFRHLANVVALTRELVNAGR